ncbi:MAG: 3-dehydroquinate synthase [Deltaproteobacteria bacterium]|nr:3-dehydroquinate synthase [Deltaproteobacteria bacterium]
MRRVIVRLGRQRSYAVTVGRGALASLVAALAPMEPSRIMLIADARLEHKAEQLARQVRRAGWKTREVSITAGDRAKDLHRAYALYSELIAHEMDRSSVILALGGGVVGDLAGFVAGTYLRGIRWVGLPSTLIAQVDSSVGGKTGVNHALGKNLIGVFHQPSAVLCDTDLLGTLDRRDRVSGFAEMVKVGLACDGAYFRSLVQNAEAVMALESDALTSAIARGVQLKARVVAKDERETTGERAILNFGHTVGHALEAVSRFRLRHGEALVVGMRVAAALSVVRGCLKQSAFEEIDRFLQTLRVDARATPSQLMPYIRRDKKSERGRVRFVLLSDIGSAVRDDGVTRSDLAEAFRKLGMKA